MPTTSASRPGGSSGGTVTAVAANIAVLGNGTDTGNSIRMPAATSALVGVYPTRGLVSIAGIAPLDWLLDNTGPIARTATDAAIALAVMAGEDPLDPRTVGSPARRSGRPYVPHLKADALKGKRFGVPAFILAGDGVPFHGIPRRVPAAAAERVSDGREHAAPARDARDVHDGGRGAARRRRRRWSSTTRSCRRASRRTASRVATYAYMRDGTNRFLAGVRPGGSTARRPTTLKAAGAPLFASSIGAEDGFRQLGGRPHRSAIVRHAIRTPSATTTRRGARRWRRISSRSIA